MNKTKIYPWIFVVVFVVVSGVVGLIVCMKIGSIYEELANDASWTLGWDKSMKADNDIATGFVLLCFLSIFIASYPIFFMDDIHSKYRERHEQVAAAMFVPMFLMLFIICKNSIIITGAFSGMFIGTVTGLIIIILANMKKEINLFFMMSAPIFGTVGAIIGMLFYSNGLIICSPLIIAFASVGYAIGTPIKEKAEHRAEIRKREKFEREKKIREEERLATEQLRHEQERMEQERLRREEEERHRKEEERRRREAMKQSVLDMIEEVKAER